MASDVALGEASAEIVVEGGASTGCASIGGVAMDCVAMDWLLERFPWEEEELDWLEGLGLWATMRSG